ncbi:MAG: ABC transporter permease subunit [Anaerolineae bacterium]|nr:ABC transporter permease subunit [Anaerolineae bacterium]
MKKIWILTRKEWAEVFKNRFVLFTVAFMPILFTILPLIILSQAAGEISAMGDVPPEFSAYCDSSSGGECAQSFILSQFLILFLIMPVMIPATIASYSIVGEKTTRTLEPLLATPITTGELLAGKALAAAIPATVATWGSYLLLLGGASILLESAAVIAVMVKPLWLLAIFGVAPLLSIAGVSVAVMISSRVNDPRIAEQISALVIMPIVLLMMGQAFGYVMLDQSILLWIALALLIGDAGLLYFATQFFQRETILTRWK